MAELHSRLEEVDVQAGNSVNHLHTSVGSFRVIPVISYQSAHHITVLLFDMTIIVLLVGARAGKGDPLLPAIIVKVLIDELDTII